MEQCNKCHDWSSSTIKLERFRQLKSAIVAQNGHTNSAAKLCLDWSDSGQSDWYLPASDELAKLWQLRFNVNKTLESISGADFAFNRKYVLEQYRGGQWE